jgi:antitoxin (DNA-binding transcriptional repressor) of toxin-antitoxin stability system
MTIVSVHEAKTHLSRLIEKVLAGEEVIVERNKQPVIKLVRAVPPKKKGFRIGAMKGRLAVDRGFLDPLPDEYLGFGRD